MATSESNSQQDDTEVLQFNLTDPDHLSEQLDAANLNDEETELLLQEALKLNAQLKEALKFQQLEEASHSAKGSRKKHQSHPLAAPMAPRNPRPSNLPPIRASGDKVPKKEHKSHASTDASKGGSASGARRKGSAKKSVTARPEWDDRFSYS